MRVRWIATRKPRLGMITLWQADGTIRPQIFDRSKLLEVTEPHGFDNNDRQDLCRQLDSTGRADMYVYRRGAALGF